ncbi:hypothetical protein Mal4_08330 [Maioricimonas rarisocia]|uniref:Uncharacterized protein n=1 Tax=Maioricimonas rarisocia TaxID=2528026 RepID=A0A517Z250_9PLAN|nr:hypothetical protein Mal4_08330 [Maioricimonas rarisocia]
MTHPARLKVGVTHGNVGCCRRRRRTIEPSSTPESALNGASRSFPCDAHQAAWNAAGWPAVTHPTRLKVGVTHGNVGCCRRRRRTIEPSSTPESALKGASRSFPGDAHRTAWNAAGLPAVTHPTRLKVAVTRGNAGCCRRRRRTIEPSSTPESALKGASRSFPGDAHRTAWNAAGLPAVTHPARLAMTSSHRSNGTSKVVRHHPRADARGSPSASQAFPQDSRLETHSPGTITIQPTPNLSVTWP